MPAVSTEGRIFAARVTREIVAREAEGASLLAPGCTRWQDAFIKFARTLQTIPSPVKCAKYFHETCASLQLAQSRGVCFVNAYLSRSRSGFMEVLTYERSTHPLVEEKGKDGIAVTRYLASVRRSGKIRIAFGTPSAFVSWHALARMAERSPVDIFEASGIVAGCGIAGILMRKSEKHQGSSISLTTEHMICVGTLRYAENEEARYGFFNVLTALPYDVPDWHLQERAQGCEVAEAIRQYVRSDDANPRGYSDKVPVLPFRKSDYVTLQLKAAE